MGHFNIVCPNCGNNGDIGSNPKAKAFIAPLPVAIHISFNHYNPDENYATVEKVDSISGVLSEKLLDPDLKFKCLNCGAEASGFLSIDKEKEIRDAQTVSDMNKALLSSEGNILGRASGSIFMNEYKNIGDEKANQAENSISMSDYKYDSGRKKINKIVGGR